MHYQDLDTPALVVDLDIMERNLRRMADYCAKHGLSLRPHTKTHKTPWLAKRQMELGASGITVAKLGEAEIMAAAGLDQVMLAYPVFGSLKAERLARLAKQSEVSIAIDSAESLEWVAQAARNATLQVLVEIDFGMRRCGLPPGEEPVRLAAKIQARPGLEFAGIMFYGGHVHPDFEGNERRLQRLATDLSRQLERFERAGLTPRRVSGGSTPSAFHSHQIPGLTEIRPGTYIFNDRNTVEWKACGWEDCAAFISTTVVSTSVPGQAIIDGGSKTFSSDTLACGKNGGFGIVRSHPEVTFVRMNEEHGYLQLPTGLGFQPGDRLEVVPNHICAAVNLHERAWGIRGGEVVQEWEIKGRGKIR